MGMTDQQEYESLNVMDVMSLNIGCGGTRQYPYRDLGCTVNCDIQRPQKKIDSFVQCDACCLPFVDKVFSRTFALHLVEHLDSPSVFLKECSRVTHGYVSILTPNLYSENSFKDKGHVQHFTDSTLRMLLERFFKEVKIVGEGGFWLPVKGNTFVFRLLKPVASKFTFLATNLLAICRNAKAY